MTWGVLGGRRRSRGCDTRRGVTGGMWRGHERRGCDSLGELAVPGLARKQAARMGPAHGHGLVCSPWPEGGRRQTDELGLVPWAALGRVCRPWGPGLLSPLALQKALRVSSLAALHRAWGVHSECWAGRTLVGLPEAAVPGFPWGLGVVEDPKSLPWPGLHSLLRGRRRPGLSLGLIPLPLEWLVALWV